MSGMRVSDLVSDARRDLARDADLGLGMIVRQKNALLDIEVIAFDLASVIASPNTDSDPVLKEFDEVLVFSLVTADLTDADATRRASSASRTSHREVIEPSPSRRARANRVRVGCRARARDVSP